MHGRSGGYDSMIDFFEKTKGSISLFLALIMLPMMTVAGLIVDGARISAAKASLSGAGDLAMNAALSEYDQILYDVYGIFAVSENMEELQNNVSRYFANSIDNTGILNDSDSYTREFINSIFSSFSGDEMEFNNIVDLKADRFTLQGVESSAIGNPKVLERQIVDYMKYRGPINIGKGLLTKLGCIGETSKQTKAIEAKVNYDQKLDTVQDACKKAYEAINEYNDLIGGNSKFASNEYLNQLSQDIDSAKKDVADMVKYLVAYNSSELNVPPLINERPSSLDSLRVIILKDQWAIFKVDSATRKEVESYYKKSKAANRELDTMAYIEGKLAERGIKVVPVENGDYGIDFGINYDEKMLKLEITQSTDLGKEIGYVKIYKELPNVKSSFTYALMYGMYAEKLPDEMKVPDKKAEAYTELAMFLGEGGSWAELWGENATEKGRSAASKLYAWDKDISAITGALEKADTALAAVLQNVDELDEARTNWANKVDNLSEGDVKTSMQGEYENAAKDINKDAINSLRALVDTYKKHFDSVKSVVEGIKLYDKPICREDYGSVDYKDEFSSSIGKNDFTELGQIESQATQIMNSKYTGQSVSSVAPGSAKKVTEEEQFYAYLCRVCASANAKKNKTSKDSAESLKKNLISAGNSGANSTQSTAGLPADIPGTISASVDESVRKAIDQLCSDEGGKENKSTFHAEKVDSDSDKEATKNNKNNLTKISELLKLLGQVAEAGRDKLYLQEYMTEMFSCYTDTLKKDGDGNLVAKAMNGKDMTNNPYFGAEAEYILWGNDSVTKNLQSTRAMIFGVRFALNAVYAFTSTDTTVPALTAATAIAGWTGFGVPIVKTVILLAWAMAESFVDVKALCDEGKAVALYKTTDTWSLGYGGLKDKVKADAANLIENVASRAVDDIFDKLENTAVDASGKLVDFGTETTDRYIRKTLDGVYESVRSAITGPISQLALQITGASQTLSQADIMNKVEQTLKGLKNSGSGLVNECINLAIENLLSTKVGSIAEQLYTMYSKAKNGTAIEEINKLLYGDDRRSGLIGEVVRQINDAIDQKIDAYGAKFKASLEQKITEGGNQVKEEIKDEISSFTAGIAGDSAGSSGSAAAASGLTMNYKEYVKTFIMIHLLMGDGSKNAMLTRTAQLLQANIQQQSRGFDVTKAFTVVTATAEVSVRTTFFQVPVATVHADNETSYELDFSRIGTGYQKLKYSSVLGY